MTEDDFAFIPHNTNHYSESEMNQRAEEFYREMSQRRTIRDFSDKEVPIEVIENIIKTAGTSPSGAHKQPWTFCVVSNPVIKKKIRLAAEEEEFENYHGRMPEEWLKDLRPFGTDWHKPFLEIAPYLIIVFRKVYDLEEGTKKKNYYVQESVGIATGILLAAIHNAGLVSLTHTPSPMNFLCEVLQRPENEKPFVLIPVGYPAEKVMVPDISRKPLSEISVFYK